MNTDGAGVVAPCQCIKGNVHLERQTRSDSPDLLSFHGLVPSGHCEMVCWRWEVQSFNAADSLVFSFEVCVRQQTG